MKKIALPILLILLPVLVACGSEHDTPTPTAAPAAQPTKAPADLVSILGNLTYIGVLPNQPVTLSAGVASYEDEGGGQPFVELMDTLIAIGDLDGDGAEDVAAFLVDYTTGSADFVYLAVVLNVQAEPAPVKVFLICDRTPVKSMTIADSQVIVESIAPGPEDVACCPSQLVRQVLALEDGRLMETSREELGVISLADLDGTSWQLVDLDLDQEPVPAGTVITMEFAEGQISGSGGCNNYHGSITGGEDDLPQSLTVGTITATQMLCADPLNTLETSYLARLAKVLAWRYTFGHLSLTYKLEDAMFGELLFAPQDKHSVLWVPGTGI